MEKDHKKYVEITLNEIQNEIKHVNQKLTTMQEFILHINKRLTNAELTISWFSGGFKVFLALIVFILGLFFTNKLQ